MWPSLLTPTTPVIWHFRVYAYQMNFNYIHSRRFKDITEIKEETYNITITMRKETYKCETCIQKAFFTRDNAKHWYLVFIYDLIAEYLDIQKLYFIEGDTDSMYWAVAGNHGPPNTQAVQYVINNNKECYDENIFKFAPSDFFVNNEEVRPKLASKEKITAHEKKLLDLATEKQGDNMIALCPKCYT